MSTANVTHERLYPGAGQIDDEAPAMLRQVGGSHYLEMDYQPWHCIEDLLTREEFVGFLKGSLIKYAMRQGRKLGSDDAAKAQHYRDKLKEIQG